MEPGPSYWVLHEWLFKAFWIGECAGRLGQMPRGIAYCGMFGPGWRDEVKKMEQEIFYEHLMDMPETKVRLEKEWRKQLAIMEAPAAQNCTQAQE